MIREVREKTVADVFDTMEDIKLTIDLMERRQEMIEQVAGMTLALMGFIFVLIV